MFRAADVQVRELDARTYELTRPQATERERENVWEKYMLWLVCIRQVAVSINTAGVEAESPEQFRKWWAGLLDDPEHRFFWDERNDVLKKVADTIRIRPTEDGSGNEIGYWVFRSGPSEGMPLTPVCQKYTERVYNEMIGEATRLLWGVVLSRTG